MPGLTALRGALEQALGLRFQGEGGHFFRLTLVQTLFDGVFSAWVLWSKSPERRAARVRLEGHGAPAPCAGDCGDLRSGRDGVGHVAAVGADGAVGVGGTALNRVERGPFFAPFAEDEAVQYFYEPFLEVFDPELRQQLGVWYTPPEVVAYMVERVDRALREELGIRDGLADERRVRAGAVYGDGGVSRGESAADRADAARARGGRLAGGRTSSGRQRSGIRGFEKLPAPFVVAHLQLGLLLQELGAPLVRRARGTGGGLSDERVDGLGGGEGDAGWLPPGTH